MTVRFTLNGRQVQAERGSSLLAYIRDVAGLKGAKNACGEGACGACSVLVDGKLLASCVVPVEKVEGKSVMTVEGIEAEEMELYAHAFAEAGAVQCGFCTPGMVMAAKALLDANPMPSEAQARAGLRRNLCRCTGYAKIVAAVLLAARLRTGRASTRTDIAQPVVARNLNDRKGSDARFYPAVAMAAAPAARAAATAGAPTGIGSRMRRIDAGIKARGEARYVDDIDEPGSLFGAVLRSPHARARLESLDVEAARALPGVVIVATWLDVPGKRHTGHIIADWPCLVAVGEETRYVGDAIALVAAETKRIAREALGLIRTGYEVLEPIRDPEAALAPGACAIHEGGNLLSRLELRRGDAEAALAKAAFRWSGSFSTPFTDHAFMEPESALAWPPDAEGVVFVRTGEQNVYDGRKYVADTLGLAPEKVRVVSAFVGGGFGGKEDQSVQHHAALLAWLAGRPVKLTLSREESSRVHVKRHAMRVDLDLGCDPGGKILGAKARIVADTGAYASLGGPVLHRAVTHLGGPYAYSDIDVEGLAVFTNNPPGGAFRGFGVPQVNFAFESALNELARRAGITPWEIRFRNAVRPGDALPNGQVAGPDAALAECLLAVRGAFDAVGGKAGLACAFKNTGIGVGHADIGRCRLGVLPDRVRVFTGAACIGQGLATILTQIACEILGLEPERVEIALPDTGTTPNSGTTTASRQTLITGEACRRACEALLAELPALAAPGSAEAFRLAPLAGREFLGEYEAATDPFDSRKANPVRHVAYSYACQLATLGADGKVDRIVAAHDSGLVVNPLSFEGQVEGGVAMGFGFALTEDFPLVDCVPQARFGSLGIPRATDMPRIETIIVRKEGPGSAVDGGMSGAAYGAKGIGEISTIPTAAAIAGAYFALDGLPRTSLPLAGTPYERKSR